MKATERSSRRRSVAASRRFRIGSIVAFAAFAASPVAAAQDDDDQELFVSSAARRQTAVQETHPVAPSRGDRPEVKIPQGSPRGA